MSRVRMLEEPFHQSRVDRAVFDQEHCCSPGSSQELSSHTSPTWEGSVQVSTQEGLQTEGCAVVEQDKASPKGGLVQAS